MVLKCQINGTPCSTWSRRCLVALTREARSRSGPFLSVLYPQIYSTRTIGVRRTHSDTQTTSASQSTRIDHVKSSAKHSATRAITRKRSSKWVPFSEKGRSDLKELLASLDAMTKQSLSEKDTSEEGHRPYLSMSRDLPESPVTRRMKYIQGRAKARKKAARTTEKQTSLDLNPWARILASPIRHCRSTEARIPEDLLTEWTLVHNPVDGRDYMMPQALAASRDLAPPVKKVDGSTLQGFRTDMMQQAEPDGESENHNSSNAKTYTERPLMMRLTNSIEHIYHLSQSMTRENAKSQARIGAVVPLLPVKPKIAIGAAHHYETMRRQNLKQMGLPVTPPANPEAQIALRELGWKHDIAFRMLKIMRQRILMALQSHAEQCSTGRARHQRRLLTVPIGDNEELTIRHGKILFSSTAGLECLHNHAATGQDAPNTAEPEGSYTSNWIKGSFCIRVTPLNSATGDKLPFDENLLVTNPVDVLTPPLLTVDTDGFKYRIPVFEMSQLLGKDELLNFMDLITEHEILQFQPVNKDMSYQTSASYVMLMKPNPSATRLSDELWRLWRYVGGHANLVGKIQEQAIMVTNARHRRFRGPGNDVKKLDQQKN